MSEAREEDEAAEAAKGTTAAEVSEAAGELASAAPDTEELDWAVQRRRAAAERARMLAERQRAENERAAGIIELFLEVARAENLENEPLIIQGYGGGTARTKLRGWYLRADRTVAIDTEGRFYVLSQRLSFKERLLGAAPTPEPPPLTIGEGGRDGDIVPLRFALDRLLPDWEARSPRPLP